MNTLDLTKKLISIPSWVDKGTDEKQIGEFICDYLRKFTYLKITKQQVSNGRFNILVQDKFPTTLFLCGHIDTVEAKNKQQLIPKIVNGRLYGLGATDMKCTVACLMKSAELLKNTQGVGILFYVDEEYDFAGMQKFIDEYKNKIKPKLIVGEGSNCQITNGCRGLIEIKFTIKGKTAHAARADQGINAIDGSQKIINRISAELEKYVDPIMGKTSFNVASINGGLNLGEINNEIKIGRQGNNVADYCEFILDIRPANNKLRAKTIIEMANKKTRSFGLTILSEIRHDKLGWISPISALPNPITDKYDLSKDYQSGYLDIQMMNEAFGCPCFGFGAGEPGQAHKEKEYVDIKKIYRCEEFYRDLIVNWKGGEN